MRLRLDFDLPEGRMVLPVNYNHYVQAMIYNSISEKLADFLHEKGFTFEKRQFRLFVFSRMMGEYRVDRGGKDSRIIFYPPVHFYLSAPFEEILQEFANRMVSGVRVFLEANQLTVTSVKMLPEPDVGHKETLIKMISPATVRSTLDGENDSHKTHYYTPREPEFSKRVRDNLIKKYHALYGEFPKDSQLEIKPLYFSEKKNFHLIMYKGFVIKAYSGIFRLTGSPELRHFAYHTGIGERNSQGFGMFELWKEKKW